MPTQIIRNLNTGVFIMEILSVPQAGVRIAAVSAGKLILMKRPQSIMRVFRGNWESDCIMPCMKMRMEISASILEKRNAVRF